jgi:hypothetical protein
MNEPTPPLETLNPRTWEGDFDQLPPFQEDLLYDEELCEIFYSKREAFCAGFYLGRKDAEQRRAPTQTKR